MADKSDQKKSHEIDKNSSEEEKTLEAPEKSEEVENQEDISEEKTSESPGREQIKPQKLKPDIIFKTILMVLLIGALSWTIYYSYNTIQNNLLINNKIKKTAEEIYRIQAEQDKIKEAIKSFEDNSINRIQEEQDKIKRTIKSFQNNRDDLEKLLMAVNKLNKELSGLQDEVKVLQIEINKKPDFLSPRQVQVDDIPSKNNQPAKLEIKKEAEIKIEESVLIEKSEEKEEPEVKKESSKDVRSKVINFIEDTTGIIFQKTGDAFKWIKEKIFLIPAKHTKVTK